jgi:myo-inositol-1(or 4)-monophosphatase
MMFNPEEILSTTKKAVAEAADYIKSEVGKVSDHDIEEKELNSLVSYVDKTAEEMLVKSLGAILPEAGFITEEETEDIKDRKLTWIIDPLDGTTNYLHQIPHFCVSVALRYESEVVIGLVHEVMGDEQFYAVKGKGAYMNERSIKVSNKSGLDQVLVATGFPYTNQYNVDASFERLKSFLLQSRGMRRMGSAALDLSYVAIGRLGVYYEGSLNAWDLAAGALIVEEAGGKVSDYAGNRGFLESGEIIASAPQFYNQVMEILQQH